LVTDFIQFGIAMTGSFAAAYFALQQPQVGGLHGLFQKIDPATLGFLPDFGNWGVAAAVLIIPITVQWWSVWYPGAEPGGGSYMAQRMLASKSEKDAIAGTLFFNVAHYALRPWPWIIVALASLLVYPQLSDIAHTFPYVDPALIGHDMAYPAMLRFLPVGFLGLMIAGLLAAYVSTLSTHLNWGTSYLVHDFYRRFLRPGRDERHYVAVGRWVTVGLMICAGFLTFILTTARETFDLMLSVGAGTGLLYLLRWFWWRSGRHGELVHRGIDVLLRRQNGAPGPRIRGAGVDGALDHRRLGGDRLPHRADRSPDAAQILQAGPPRGPRLGQHPRRGGGGPLARLDGAISAGLGPRLSLRLRGAFRGGELSLRPYRTRHVVGGHFPGDGRVALPPARRALQERRGHLS
jgi:hypothetical protein